MFEGKNDNLLYFILLKLPSFMTVLLKVQGAPAALYFYFWLAHPSDGTEAFPKYYDK